MNQLRIDVQGLLRQFGLRPDKSLGQNFLVDEAALERVVEAAQVTRADTVLEIGAGLGSLTCYLAQAAQFVVAVELDGDLIPPLQQVLAPYPNIRLVQGDILALNLTQLIQSERYLVVANIPYYITSALIRHLLESQLPPQRLALTVQKEVAQRICAHPGDLSLLALSVQVYGNPMIAAHIPADAFYPPPKVDSAIIRVDIYPEPRIPPSLLKTFFRLSKAGFSQKRKTLRNALSGGLAWSTTQVGEMLQNACIDPFRRAETLSLEEWQHICSAYLTLSSKSLPPPP
jgi:16S rRNA (adenine1518-N6/adenine1519-N6)-dimethyltransferase